MVLLRFAPSPTGPLHLGGLRMALYNYLYARKHGGKWLLRIEDTDSMRTVPGSVEGIQQALHWAGLEYDYGPGKEGPHAPYYQSERRDLYRSYANKLLDKGHAYRCFCSADDLAAIKTRLARSGSNATYDKRCLHLSDEEVARKVKAGEKFVVRVNDSIPPNRPPTSDLVFGTVRDAHASLATDPVLLKSDLFPTYHLASVVDDHEMGITHVLRGEEWLVSLPLHLDLYTHLNLKPPQFAHIPILLNPDRTKMSKRHGDVRVVDYIKRGWEPEAILNWLALAGWGASHSTSSSSSPFPSPSSTLSSSPSSTPSSTPSSSPSSSPHPDPETSSTEAPTSTHLLTLPEMISTFSLTSLTHRSSVLDPTKLEYMNKHHLMKIWETPEGLERLARGVVGALRGKFAKSPYTTVENVKHAIKLLEGRLTNIYDIPLHAPYLFIDPDLTTDEARNMIKRVDAKQLAHILQTLSTQIHSTPWTQFLSTPNNKILEPLHIEREKLGMGNKSFMMVLRYAITGMKDGPGIVDIIRVLGPEKTLARLAGAMPKKTEETSVS